MGIGKVIKIYKSMKISGKFTEQLLCVGRWIQQRKKFLFLSHDYVVVGLNMDEHVKHFPSKDNVKKEHQLIIDEVAKIDDGVWDILDKRLNKSMEKEPHKGQSYRIGFQQGRKEALAEDEERP